MPGVSVKVGVFVGQEEGIHKERLMAGYEHESLNTPEKNLWREQVKKMMTEEIDQLKVDERLVLSLYYDEELTLREIGQVMDKTESRICQVHNEAMAKLSRRLRKRIEVDRTTPFLALYPLEASLKSSCESGAFA
jgi:RNA polymerase sigma factor for flagellar operon FliA